jgi:dihydropyrimidine dehydrogenase (NAD+) subunit PreT
MTSIANPEIAHRFAELHPPFTPQQAVIEANRCLYCWNAPCAAACPTHIDVPKFIKKISSGNLRGAALTIFDANILGSSCARVCPVDVLCEGACVLNAYNREPIAIGLLQRFATDTFRSGGDSTLPRLAAPARTLRVACIGAGPASLSCAAELARRGHSAVIFEARPLAGGLNTYGVAEYKLRALHAVQEVEFVQSLGVEIRCGEYVGPDRLRQLAAECDAVFLGLGLGKMERLGIPGENLDGVVDALRFIADYKTAQTIPVGRRVVVVGAGNTAIDAANAARRLGAEEVITLYRRTVREMPAFLYEYEHAKRHEVDFQWLVRPTRILGQDGHVAGIECVRLTPEFETIAGSEFIIFCDMLIPAIGQSRAFELLSGIAGLEISGGAVAVDRPTGRTGNPKFYAGGDIVNGGREVVDAVADGKRAALAIIGSASNA